MPKLLGNRKGMLITRLVKGAGLMLLNRKIFVNKVINLLSDDIKFLKQINVKNKTRMTKKQLSGAHKRMKNDHVHNEVICEQIKQSKSVIPLLHGLPKIHEPGLPLRSIPEISESPFINCQLKTELRQ